MPPARSKSAWLLLPVAGFLGILIGVVGSGGRRISRPREAGPFEAWSGREAVQDELRAPQMPPSPEANAEAVEAKVVTPTPAARREVARLTVFVSRPDGTPASSARLVLGKQHGRADAEGRSELALGDDPGPVDLCAFEPGYEPAVRAAFGATLNLGGENTARLTLGPETLSLAGFVVDDAGQPQKNWTVELDGQDTLATFGLRERVRTDGEGRFLLTDVPEGVHVLRAFEERRELAFRSDPCAAGEPAARIVVQPAR